MILDTRNYQDSIEVLVENIKAKFLEAGALLGDVVNKGQIKFRRIRDSRFPSGMYLQIAFQAPGTAPELIRSKFRLDQTVNRLFIENQ
jgi:small subunit ribosomal protein S6